MLFIVLLAILFALFYYKIKKAHSFWEKRGVKYVKPMFLFGNMNMFQPVDKSLDTWYSTYPDERYCGIYSFTLPLLVIRDPDLIKQIKVKDFESFMDHRQLAPADVDPFINTNLFTLRGNEWRNLRATLSPSFTASKMKIMFNLIDKCAKNVVRYFEIEAIKTPVQELEMKDLLSRYSNDVIASTSFGIECDSLKDRENEFFLMGKEVTETRGLRAFRFLIPTISPTLARLFRIKIVPDEVKKFFISIITETVKTREKNHTVRPDMINLLMEAQKGRQQQDEEDTTVDESFSKVEESSMIKSLKKKPITLDDIISQAFIFFFAGFDTVSTAISFSFYELAINPDVQSKLRDEILSIEGNITYEKLMGMKYLDMVVSESLRKWPPAPLSDRRATKSYIIEPVKPGEKPYNVQVDDIITIPIFCIQRDPKYFPNPEKFDPERFSDENKHKINPSTYMPFSLGPRSCVGSRFALLEMKLMIFNIFKSFEIVPTTKTPIPMVMDNFAVAPKKGMWLGLKKI